MRGRGYKGEGVVLRRREWGEADRILVVFSREHGKLSLMAKGVRKPLSRKRGHVEVFSRVRFSASKTRGMDVMTEAEMMDSFSEMRENLRLVAVAYYFCEVIEKVTREEEKNEELYELLVDYLAGLPSAGGLQKVRKRFVTEVLETAGFWPKGRVLADPDRVLEEVVERRIASARVGRKILE